MATLLWQTNPISKNENLRQAAILQGVTKKRSQYEANTKPIQTPGKMGASLLPLLWKTNPILKIKDLPQTPIYKGVTKIVPKKTKKIQTQFKPNLPVKLGGLGNLGEIKD